MNLASRFHRLGRKAIRTMVMIVATAVLLDLAALAARWSFNQWRQGRVVLTTDGPPLKVQVLDESEDEPIGEPVDLVARSTLALPAGDYRLEVTGAGRLSRTYRFAVTRGETLAHSLTLDEGRLMGEEPTQPFGTRDARRKPPIPFAPNTVAIELASGKADLVKWTDHSIVRFDGVTGEVVWDALAVPRPGQPPRVYHPWLLWFAGHSGWARLVRPAPDLDGDGTRDLVWTFQGDSAFLALSGKDGSVLWTYLPELDRPGGAYPEGPGLPGPIRPATRPMQIIGAPTMADLDRDGVPDLIATLFFQEFPAEVLARRPELAKDKMAQARAILSRRVVEGISGRSGKPLWCHPVDPAFTTIRKRIWDRPATPVQGRQVSIVAVVDGTVWQGLDPATGRPQSGPIDLGFEPVRPLQYADLDGDGEPEILALGPGPTGKSQSLSAFSNSTGRPLWSVTVNAAYETPYDNTTAALWPLVVDLDGDGRSEIVVPDSGALDPKNGYRGTRMLDGSSGQPRWTRPMRPDTKADDGLVHIVDAPDLDRDGFRDLVTTSIFIGRQPVSSSQGGPSEPERVYVDAISGKDGRPLWWWHVEIPTDQFTFVATPRWWGRGPDGWPLLAAPIGGRHPQFGHMRRASPSELYPSMVHIFEASTGRVVHTLTGFENTEVADLDADGLPDLWGEYQGDLRAFRGQGPETWRALGAFYPAHDSPYLRPHAPRREADFDGDGIDDALSAGVHAPGDTPSTATGSRTAIARSGRDGHLLWRTELDARRGWFDRDRGENYTLTSFPLTAGDLDGDGTPDVIVQENARQPPAQALKRPATLPLMLLSGHTGRPLWMAGPLPLDFEAHGFSHVYWAEPRIVDPNIPPDLLVRHNSPFLHASPTPPPPSSPTQDRLARISGRTGRVVWDVPLVEQAIGQNIGYIPASPSCHDLDGDGSLDAALLTRSTPTAPGVVESELKAVSLHDGRLLWSRPFATAFVGGAPHIEALESAEDHRPVIAAMVETSPGNRIDLAVRALDGRDGKEIWTWNGGAEYPINRPPPMMVAMAPDGGTKRQVGLNFQEFGGKRRIVVLDASGRERARRDIPGEYASLLLAADFDGDGRDELLVWHAGRLHAWGRDLKELWSWPDNFSSVESILPPSAGRTATVLLPSGVGLDGKTGLTRWATQPENVWPVNPGAILDAGDADRLPLLISHPQGVTVCRSAMPVTTTGTFAPPKGTPVRPGLARDDPRWTRPLPWTHLMLHSIGLAGCLAVSGLTLVNAVLPIGLLWLAARRRPWTLRLLMALPVAAAVPLWVFQTVEPMIPVQIGSTPVSARIVFILGTLAGLPMVLYAGFAVSSLVRRRGKALAILVALTIVASALIAAAWLWMDSRTMPAVEQYGRLGWYLVVVVGACAVGVLLPIGWILKWTYRWIKMPRCPEIATP